MNHVCRFGTVNPTPGYNWCIPLRSWFCCGSAVWVTGARQGEWATWACRLQRGLWHLRRVSWLPWLPSWIIRFRGATSLHRPVGCVHPKLGRCGFSQLWPAATWFQIPSSTLGSHLEFLRFLLLGLAFIASLVPETKGRSFAEIEALLSRPRRDVPLIPMDCWRGK